MKQQRRLLSFGNRQMTWYYKRISILSMSMLIVLFSCSKKDRHDATPPPATTDVLKIAPSQEKFDEWTKKVLETKLGAACPYTVEKISFTEKDKFKMAEVTINANDVKINFIIGTLFDFDQAPELNRYVLKPITNISTFSRTLIFSSGKSSGDFTVNHTQDSHYIVKTSEANLFFIGAM